jgi:hypothetical protein
VADLSTFDKAEQWKINPALLVDDDQRGCRDLADRLRTEGFAGVLCPSAALPGTVSLVVFGPRIAVPWANAPRLVSSVRVAEVGRSAPPEGVLARVRHRGDPHSALVHYQRATAAQARTRRRKGREP